MRGGRVDLSALQSLTVTRFHISQRMDQTSEILLFHTRTLSIIGDILQIALPKTEIDGPCFGDLAEVRDEQGRPRIAQVVSSMPKLLRYKSFLERKDLLRVPRFDSSAIRLRSSSLRTSSAASSVATAPRLTAGCRWRWTSGSLSGVLRSTRFSGSLPRT